MTSAQRSGAATRVRSRLVELYHGPLRRLALTYVRSGAVTDGVVQETWLGLITGIDRFEGRSSLKTWIVRILTNIAKTRAVREGRTLPLSALARAEVDVDDPAVDPNRFFDQQHAKWPGHWASPPTRWEALPEQRLESRETLDVRKQALELLPPRTPGARATGCRGLGCAGGLGYDPSHDSSSHTTKRTGIGRLIQGQPLGAFFVITFAVTWAPGDARPHRKGRSTRSSRTRTASTSTSTTRSFRTASSDRKSVV